MKRRLSGEERELWDTLRRSVRPLRPQPQAPAPEPPRVEAELQSATTKPPPTVVRAAAAIARPEPPLVPLEARARRRLARGRADVDARIDLHGMRQERAFASLMGFLRRSQAHGDFLVLVITGKGRQEEGGRGVLRHSVPAWLSRPEFRDLIAGFEEAGRRHGGGGALYVRLRRRKGTGQPG